MDNAVKLDQGDAKYVDVIHTNLPLIGTPDRAGHTDFYPDGGSVHPGCLNDAMGNFLLVTKLVSCALRSCRDLNNVLIARLTSFCDHQVG